MNMYLQKLMKKPMKKPIKKPMKKRAKKKATDSEILDAVTMMLGARGLIMRKALNQEHLEDGAYLDEGTRERTYWHAGYADAMHDTLTMILRRVGEYPMVMTASKQSRRSRSKRSR
jgi:hypothetical protein